MTSTPLSALELQSTTWEKVTLVDEVVVQWVGRYTKDLASDTPVVDIVRANAHFAMILRLAALATSHDRDRDTLLALLGEDESQARARVASQPVYGPAVDNGSLREAMLSEIPGAADRVTSFLRWLRDTPHFSCAKRPVQGMEVKEVYLGGYNSRSKTVAASTWRLAHPYFSPAPKAVGNRYMFYPNERGLRFLETRGDLAGKRIGPGMGAG